MDIIQENKKLMAKRAEYQQSAQNVRQKSEPEPSASISKPRACEYCGAELKPIPFKIWEKTRYIPAVCDCQQTQTAEAKKADDLRRGYLTGMANTFLMSAGIWGGKLDTYRFQTWDVKRYAKAESFKRTFLNYAETVQFGPSNCLWVYGPYGTGKTHLAVATLRQVIFNHIVDDQPWNGYYCDWNEHCDLVKESWGDSGQGDEGTLWNKLRRSHIVVIDDLDKGRSTGWALKKLLSVIQHRYNRQKPTIITANRSTKELQELWVNSSDDEVRDAGGAILSRLSEQVGVYVAMKAKDQRDS